MDPLTILIIAAVIVVVIGRRLAGEPLSARRLAIMPLALLVVGIDQFAQAKVGLPAAAWAYLGVEAVVMLALGAVRGMTIALYERDGHLWYRYRWTTLAIWLLAIALRVGSGVLAAAAGVHLPSQAMYLTLGISFVGEAMVVGPRALGMGTPLAPSKSQRRIAAHGGPAGGHASSSPSPSPQPHDR